LNNLGVIGWFSNSVGAMVAHMDWVVAFLIIALAYFYSHYFFASATAHVSAMYAALLTVSIGVGTPPMLAALVLAFFSNIYMGITHYGTGNAPVWYGMGYVKLGPWWGYAFILSVVNILIWVVIGGLWWRVIGLW
jgi:DASS family divalent anion:Na+ symporter